MTARAGDRVILQCLAEGDPIPKIVWISNRLGRLDRRGQNYKILKNGSLEFASLEKGDEGGYKCRARNMYGEAISEEAELRVESPPRIVEAPDSLTVARGEELELQCSATGDPPPIISWLKDGHQVRVYVLCD